MIHLPVHREVSVRMLIKQKPYKWSEKHERMAEKLIIIFQPLSQENQQKSFLLLKAIHVLSI